MASSSSAFSAALTHPLNALMLGSGALSAATSGSALPLVITGMAELIWLFGLSRSGAQRRRFALEQGQRAAREVQRGAQRDLRGLSEDERRRFMELELVRKDVHRLAEGNDRLSAELLVPELAKVDHLSQEYLRLLRTVSEQRRLERDGALDQMVSEAAAARAEAEGAPTDRSLADRAELLESRAERRAQLGQQRAAGEAQLDEVETGLRLLRDQVATMSVPTELSGQLDSLVGAVEAVERTSQELGRLSTPEAAWQRQA